MLVLLKYENYPENVRKMHYFQKYLFYPRQYGKNKKNNREDFMGFGGGASVGKKFQKIYRNSSSKTSHLE